MSTVPIVQGVAVADPYQKQQQQHHPTTYDAAGNNNNNNGDYVAVMATPEELQVLREHPTKKFQDVGWAVLFLAHLVAMVVVISFGFAGSSGGDGGGDNAAAAVSASYSGIIFIVSVTALVGVGLSSVALSFMMNNTETLVQTALIFSVLTSLAVGIVGLMTGSIMMGVMGLICFAVGICYAKIVWPRIPFAASNLVTALSAVRANLGLAVVAYGLTAVACAWSIFWFLGLGGALSAGEQGLGVVFLLFLSYYWVHQVLQNTVHVTTAGVVGTWWFVPDEASTCCSSALYDSFFRATTYSFGSICFGSLLVALVQALRALEYYARDNDDFALLSCVIQCILSCIQGIIEYMNRWAYVYVGLYGFSYLDAGRNVIQLFQSKGWTVIISDDLCDNVLFMMALAVGLAAGLVGMVLGYMQQNLFAELGFENPAGPAFLMGFLTGYLIASILMSIVGSAVNTVIVCFAEAPREFEQNHPALSERMRSSWTQAWPELSF